MIGRIGSAWAWMAVAMVGLIGPAAAAQQITEAIWSVTERAGYGPEGGGTDYSFPAAAGGPGAPLVYPAVGCGEVYFQCAFEQLESEVRFSGSGVGYGWISCDWRVVAGAQGASVVCTESRGAHYAIMGGEIFVLAAGQTYNIAPYGALLIHSEGGWPNGALAARFAVELGQVESFDHTGLSVSLSLDFAPRVICTATKPWTIAESDLVCDTPFPDCPRIMRNSFDISSDASGLSVWANASEPSRVEFGCNFYLNTPALVRYEQFGGFYCDGFPRLDGNLFPTPSATAACLGLEGYLNLSEGWHSIEAEEWDSGNGSFSLQVFGGPGIDCNCNGRPDIGEILWWNVYGYSETGSDPDADDDGYLDSCGMPGDLNGSGTVDGADMAILLDAWGRKGTGADIDCNGSVDGVDLALLLDNWSRSS